MHGVSVALFTCYFLDNHHQIAPMPILGRAAYAYAAAASNASETTLRITCANKALKILNL